MDDAVVLTRHKLDVDGYYRMADAGILDPNARVELIDGEIIDMAPIGEDHAATVSGLTLALVRACGDLATVSPQNPVRLDRLNEPQPDFAMLRLRADRYRTEHPGPADVLLLVEVADSSLRFDRTIKLPLYAKAGIPELWIVDLEHRVLDAYRRPLGDEYSERTTHREGEILALSMAPAIRVTLDRVFD